MSKHSLIGAGLGLGLMAASMGANAQLHTFDYSSMFYGAVAGGTKYVAFVPTATRGSSAASEGAAGVLMLELFQPVSGTGSTWAYGMGGAVGPVAGGSGGTDNYNSVVFTAANGLGITNNYYFGDNDSIALAFNQVAVGSSSQACNVAFSAVISNNDQLFISNVNVQPSAGWTSAGGAVSITASVSGANSTTLAILQADWNNASATLATYAFANVSLTGAGVSASGTAAVNNILKARNNCVPAYNARTSGGGTSLTGQPIGMVRVW